MNRRFLVFGAIFYLSFLNALPYNYAEKSPSDADIQLPNASNTCQPCVDLAREVLKQNQAEATKNAPELIKCLEGDYFYFEKGAAKTALVHN